MAPCLAMSVVNGLRPGTAAARWWKVGPLASTLELDFQTVVHELLSIKRSGRKTARA